MEIRRQAHESIKQQQNEYQNKLFQELQRLEELQKSKINYQRQKIRKEIAQKIIHSTLQRVEQKFQDEFDENSRKKITLLLVEKFKRLEKL